MTDQYALRASIIVLINTRTRRHCLMWSPKHFLRLSYEFVTVFIGRFSGGQEFRQSVNAYGSIVADNGAMEEDEAVEIEEVCGLPCVHVCFSIGALELFSYSLIYYTMCIVIERRANYH